MVVNATISGIPARHHRLLDDADNFALLSARMVAFDEPNTYLWPRGRPAAEHWIVAVKEENNQAIYITAVARVDE
jgi:hypothetical protein